MGKHDDRPRQVAQHAIVWGPPRAGPLTARGEEGRGLCRACRIIGVVGGQHETLFLPLGWGWGPGPEG